MTKKQKKNLIRIIISAVLMILLIFIPVENKWLKLALYMIPYLIVGYDILIKATSMTGRSLTGSPKGEPPR